MKTDFKSRLNLLTEEHRKLLNRENEKVDSGNGIFHRYKYPVLTGDHAPLYWRYDLDPVTNPHLMERFGLHAAFKTGDLSSAVAAAGIARTHELKKHQKREMVLERR